MVKSKERGERRLRLARRMRSEENGQRRRELIKKIKCGRSDAGVMRGGAGSRSKKGEGWDNGAM